ncbi:uncharacterized protein [Periplaneta americana]|uniref:uncharacterized protein n=1 Tax=Periplaneta americana TaxID=6978 RepID=UPI0037E921F5
MTMLSVAVVVLLMVVGSHEHGMLMDPVNRASMWRVGYNTPENYEDNQNYCGGFQVQWNQNGGKCGECGDDYALPRPRPNENTGTYGTGIVVQKYKAGSTITTVNRITANHWGSFYYKICKLASSTELETEECFAKYPLRLVDGSEHYTLTSHSPGDYQAQVVLPAGLTCDRCVLQWTYVTANNWGICPNGTGADGCGPQETFRSCSDISIY